MAIAYPIWRITYSYIQWAGCSNYPNFKYQELGVGVADGVGDGVAEGGGVVGVGSSDGVPSGVGVSLGVGETGGGARAVAHIFAASVAIGNRTSHSQLDNDLSYCSIAAQGSEADINWSPKYQAASPNL